MPALITKEEFLKAYNAYPPNKWTKFVYRYFSTSTIEDDEWLKTIFESCLIISFLTGFIGTIANAPLSFTVTFSIILGILLLTIGILKFGAFFMNNTRIRKIRRSLGGITFHEYDVFAAMYLE